MSHYEDIVNKIRSFVEINGRDLPTDDQWSRILDIVFEEDTEMKIINMTEADLPDDFADSLLSAISSFSEKMAKESLTSYSWDEDSKSIVCDKPISVVDTYIDISDIPDPDNAIEEWGLGTKILDTERLVFALDTEIKEFPWLEGVPVLEETTTKEGIDHMLKSIGYKVVHIELNEDKTSLSKVIYKILNVEYPLGIVLDLENKTISLESISHTSDENIPEEVKEGFLVDSYMDYRYAVGKLLYLCSMQSMLWFCLIGDSEDGRKFSGIKSDKDYDECVKECLSAITVEDIE